MRFFRAEGLHAADRAAAEAGVPTYDLMLAAGRSIAAALRRRWPSARRVAALCGPGNNGGDGYVAARALGAAGLEVHVHELRAEPTTDDARRARRELLDAALGGVRVTTGEDVPPLTVGVVIDALFGSGLSRPLEGQAAAWIEALVASRLPVLAIDVPSGVRADRAGLEGPVVRADLTVQLAGAVAASALAPARGAFGAWEVAPIGIPETILDAHAAGVLLEHADVRPRFGPRPDDLHKYRSGAVLVVGGSRRYAGAVELAARGAYRGGAGLVTIAASERVPSAWPETIFEQLGDDTDVDTLLREIGPSRSGASVLGPGWQVGRERLERALRAAHGPVVLDAGGLAHDLRVVARERGDVVLTPHHGEAARLLEGAALKHDPHDDPLGAALALAEAWGAIVVLKGAGTVIADASGQVALCRNGLGAMATGGTGDVLAGVLGAMLAGPDDAGGGRDERVDRFERVAAAVFLHATAGEQAGALGAGMVASDLADALPAARSQLGAG
jgi:ADP-dependent NAD(P)H-hydrate dehydratase / NAD(P)H-hydrate epimerase